MKYIKKLVTYLKLILLVLLVLYINIGKILVINNKISYLQFSKILFCIGFTILILYIFDKIINKEKIKFKDVIVILLIIFGYISYQFAFNRYTALYGTSRRNEGLLILITYYSIFLLASTIPQKHRKIIMFVIIITGIFQIAIGTIQILRITNILGYDRSFNRSMRFKKMASGTLGNPNFYSAYILICLSYIYSKLFQKNKKIIMYIIYFLLSMLFAYGLIIGNSLGCILSFIIIFIITNIVTFIKNDYKKRRRIAITVLIFISIIISAIYNNKDLNNIISTNINEIKEIFKNGINNNTGNGRLEVWKKTIEYLPEHIYNGIGIDNFEYIENGKPITLWVEKEFQVFDKAHNEFLQKLITEGVFSFITYIILLIYVTKCYFSNNNKENYPYFVVFISYVIQSFVGISVITVAPIFYMIMGFIIYQNRDINIEN